MKIQVISYDKKVKYGTEHEYTYSSLNEPISLDAFDLNIISLQTEALWTNKENDTRSIDSIDDFKSMKELIGSVKKSQVIICFPKNYVYKYAYYSNRYNHTCQLKDMIPRLSEFLKQLIPSGHPYEIVYENSETICEDTKYSSAFYFNNVLEGSRVLSKCIGGDHCTTYRANSKLIFTTLDLSKQDVNINDFLKGIGIIEKKSNIPQWINEIKFLDDECQEAIVADANKEIEKQRVKIRTAQEKLTQNLHYKSILFETGEALVSVVFEILEKMLKYDLSDFIDKKDEDFRIIFDDVTFIGEIKGITSNVKNENVSQLDVHCQTYIDGLDENGTSENVKGILIITPLRNRPLSKRDNVHEKQIQLAKRNGSLIITTEILLDLFVAYLENHLSTEKIIELLKNKTGLLQTSDLI